MLIRMLGESINIEAYMRYEKTLWDMLCKSTTTFYRTA